MNLALESLNEFSSLGVHGLVHGIEPTMPRHFLLSTAQLQPRLGGYRSEIQEVAQNIDLGGPAAHRNPEVFAQIALLARDASEGRDPIAALELLEVQLGLLHIDDAQHLGDRIVRLTHVDGSIRSRRSGSCDRIDGEIIASIDSFPGRVLLPWTGLYRDLVPSNLYPDHGEPYDRSALISKVSGAAQLVQEYAPDVASDLCRVVQLVVLVPNLHDSRQWSYNLRLGYFGAIFINACTANRFGIAEALIHEYLHQRLWQWWTYEAPEGLPGGDAILRSPITNRDKPAIVMLQALIIYVTAHRFYTDATRSASFTDAELNWGLARRRELAVGIPQLAETLRQHVVPGTTAAAMIDHAVERFAPE